MMSWYFSAADDVDLSTVGPGNVLVLLSGNEPAAAGSSRASGISVVRGSAGRLFSPKELGLLESSSAIYASPAPMLIWPGAAGGALQVFGHADWPGAYGAVNVHPSLWDGRAPSVDEIVQRAMLLPDWPTEITEGPRSGCRSTCETCSAPVDLRFPFGHGWKSAGLILRAGTDEVIAEVRRSDFLWQDGPACQNCIEAAISMNELCAPAGCRYDHQANRAFPCAAEPWRATETGNRNWIAARSRYGAEAFAWQDPEPPERTRRRIRAIRKMLSARGHLSG